MVPNTHAVWYQGRRQTAAKLAARLPSEAWVLRSVGMGVQGERRQLWACLPLSEARPPGMRRWLLVRRGVDDPSDLAYHLASGPEATPLEQLLRACGSRWPTTPPAAATAAACSATPTPASSCSYSPTDPFDHATITAIVRSRVCAFLSPHNRCYTTMVHDPRLGAGANQMTALPDKDWPSA